MKVENRWLALAIACMLVVAYLIFSIRFVRAHDKGQFENTDPEVRAWYHSLMQPDAPNASCCGEADAYWADEIHVRDGKTYATITDDRDDRPLRRPHIPVGTEIEIPPNKLKWDKGNPTGHNILFVSRGMYVFCFVQSSGI